MRWQFDLTWSLARAGLTVTHLAAWVNAELMKNAAEIGQLRLLRAASLACGV
nr:hypothetical protein [Nocardia amikacinitolerans]